MKNKSCKHLFVTIICFLLVGVEAFAQKTAKQVYQNAAPCVVILTSYDESGTVLGFGSGFVARSNGVVISNYHVIKGATQIVVKLKDGDEYTASGLSVIDYDPKKDFAIIKIPAYNLMSLPVARQSDNFNSKMVRLKVFKIHEKKLSYFVYQFQNGAVKRN